MSGRAVGHLFPEPTLTQEPTAAKGAVFAKQDPDTTRCAGCDVSLADVQADIGKDRDSICADWLKGKDDKEVDRLLTEATGRGK